MKNASCVSPTVPAAILFLGAISTLQGLAGPAAQVAAWTAHGDQTSPGPEQFGTAVACADVDGNGYGDVIVGAPYYDDEDITDTGRFFVFHSGPDGTSVTPAFWSAGLSGIVLPLVVVGGGGGGGGGGSVDPRTAAIMGASVASAGDLDGDGYEDVIVGAPGARYKGSRSGRIFVYFGGPGGLSEDRRWTADGPSGATLLGQAVDGGGDIDGDGLPDVAVTCFGLREVILYSPSAPGSRTLVRRGSVAGVSGTAFGWAISRDGDFTGDGLEDLAVSDPSAMDGAGRVTIYSFTGSNAVEKTAIVGPQVGADFGKSISLADANGDGIADLLVGAPYQDANGAAHFYAGGSDGLLAPTWSAAGMQANGKFGWSVSLAGDINGDGLRDLIVGAPGHYVGAGYTLGRACMYLGRRGPISSGPQWQVGQNPAGYFYGSSVAAGNLNGDACGDILVGSPLNGAGSVYAYPGANTTPGNPTGLRQLQSGGSDLPAGDVIQGFSVVLAATVHDFDDAPVRFEVEVDGGAAILRGSSTVDPGQEARVEITIPPTGQVEYRWRVRTVDPHDAASSWIDFGGDPDFRTRTNTPPSVVTAAQRAADGGAELAIGAPVHAVGGRVSFQAGLDDADPLDQARLEVEIRRVGEPFQGQPTAVSGYVSDGMQASVDASLPPGIYHWQYRAADLYFGDSGAWTSFGGNDEAAADFAVGFSGSIGASACTGSAHGTAGAWAALALIAALALYRESRR